MNRRSFLSSSFAAAAAFQKQRAAGDRVDHRLPATDIHYRKVQSYVEDVPTTEYQWASDAAYERFRDLKYGVRLHWGPYSILGEPQESWPFLKMTYAERQRYQAMYRTWNPSGFNADEWMDLFMACGMKMFAFTSKHHDGFSMFDTRTRVRLRTNWVACKVSASASLFSAARASRSCAKISATTPAPSTPTEKARPPPA
jgi:alpha-L-fucosidase